MTNEKINLNKIEPRAKSATAELTPAQKRLQNKNRKKRAEEVSELWRRANTHERVKWEILEQKAYDFVLNSQLTEKEEADLAAAGMPTFIVNRMTPVIETMKYFVTANDPRWKAVGVDGADTDIAEIHTGVIDYVWYQSNGKAMLAQAVFDALVKSKGYVHMYVDPDADRGLGEVKFEFVDPFCVWTSPMSADFLGRDATYQIIKKDIPREHLINMLPAYADIIKKANGAWENMGHTRSGRSFESSETIQRPDIRHSHSAKDGSEDQVLPYYEMYTPKKVKLWNVIERIPPAESELIAAQQGIQARVALLQKELEVGLLETEQQLQIQLEQGAIIKERMVLELNKARQEAAQQLEQAQQIMESKVEEEAFQVRERILSDKEYDLIKDRPTIKSAVPFYETRIVKTCVVGDKLLYEFTMNLSQIPLIPIPYLHTGTPLPMSAARPLVGKQQEINKAHQIMIHNANVASNFRWKYVIGEIDEDTWENYVASPNALLPYNPGYSQSGPEPIFPQPINNAFFTVEQDSKADLEYMAGIHPPSMGIGSGSDETFRGFLAKDEFATRRIKSWISNVFEPALEHIGRVFQEMAKDTYTLHKIFRIVQPNPDGDPEQKEFEINVPIYDDNGEEIGRYNDYKTSRYDIRIVAGSTLPVNRWAVLEEYKQYLELGVIDDIAFLAETDIKNKEAIIGRKSAMAQLQQQAEQLENALSDAEGTIETLQRQLVQAGIKDQIRNAFVEIDRDKTETKGVERLVQERMRDALKQGKREIDLAKQTAEKEAKAAVQSSKPKPKS